MSKPGGANYVQCEPGSKTHLPVVEKFERTDWHRHFLHLSVPRTLAAPSYGCPRILTASLGALALNNGLVILASEVVSQLCRR